MIDQEYLAFAAAFQAEHRELRRLLQALRHALAKDRVWSQELAQEAFGIVEALDTHLHGHFSKEEEGGYLEQALAVAPRFSDEAQRLLAQHAVMLAEVKRVLETARRAISVQEAWLQLQAEARELMQKLVEHETAENQIVQQALNSGIEAE